MASTPLPDASYQSGTFRAFYSPKQYLLAAFRSLRLQVLPQLTKWRNAQEFKKTAIYQSRRAALLHVFLHVIPLLAGTTLVILNIKKTFIGSALPGGVTAIQFASKLLEILIQASIAAIMLAFVRVQVLGLTEFPFGGLITPFRTTDISSLWSLELWGCLTSTNINALTRSLLCICFPAAIILAALIGPSGAVLMIPRPITLPDFSVLQFHDETETLYPRNIGLQNDSLT